MLFFPFMNIFTFLWKLKFFLLKVRVRVEGKVIVTIPVFIKGERWTEVDWVFMIMDAEEVEGDVAGLGLFLIIFHWRAGVLCSFTFLLVHLISKNINNEPLIEYKEVFNSLIFKKQIDLSPPSRLITLLYLFLSTLLYFYDHLALFLTWTKLYFCSSYILILLLLKLFAFSHEKSQEKGLTFKSWSKKRGLMEGLGFLVSGWIFKAESELEYKIWNKGIKNWKRNIKNYLPSKTR